MLTIRAEQLDAFREPLTKAFVGRMVRHLSRSFPRQLAEQKIKKADLEPLVRQGMKRAEQYGVVYQGDVQRFLECMVILGPRFDEDTIYPWAGQTLRRTDLDGEEKMDEISDHIIFEVPHRAEQ